MVSLQKLLGKEDKFFDLFEASAEQACNSVRALRQFLAEPAASRRLDEFIVSRRKDKAITAEISAALCTSFVTVMEAEDIEALATSIYKIPKTIEKIAERVLLAPQHLTGVDLSAQVTLLERATETLLQMVREMRKGLPKARVRTLNEQLQTIEGDADKTVLEMLRGLYNDPQEAARIVFLKDIFELLERGTDRCRDAGNVISRIVLKST